MSDKTSIPIKHYKVLGKDGIACNGGTGKWLLPENGHPGDWMPMIKKIIPYKQGYHLCRVEDILEWLDEEIYEAEGRGIFIRPSGGSVDVFGEGRLIRKIESWNERTGRLFAADCAEHVLYVFENKFPHDQRPRLAIQATRDFALDKINSLVRSGAGDSAREAARDAAKYVARTVGCDVTKVCAGNAFDEDDLPISIGTVPVIAAAIAAWTSCRDNSGKYVLHTVIASDVSAAGMTGIPANNPWYTSLPGDDSWYVSRNAEKKWQTNKLFEVMGIKFS